MAQAYLLLGLEDLAEDSVAVLRLNYPDHPMLDESGEFLSLYDENGLQRSMINRMTFGLFDPPEPPQFDYQPKG